MDTYIKNYEEYQTTIIYDFKVGYGGIGDCMKFFMCALHLCMKYNYKLCYQINTIPLEKYIQLRYPQMYIDSKDSTIPSPTFESFSSLEPKTYRISPQLFYDKNIEYTITQPYEEVFLFSDEVKENSRAMISLEKPYLSIHLRLGDKYLETDHTFVEVKNDTRQYHESTIMECIEQYTDIPILFFCDNQAYKMKIKEKYDYVYITQSSIGHTGLSNTTDKQILDSVTECYIMAHSEKVYAGSWSGFSYVAARYKCIPLINLY